MGDLVKRGEFLSGVVVPLSLCILKVVGIMVPGRYGPHWARSFGSSKDLNKYLINNYSKADSAKKGERNH